MNARHSYREAAVRGATSVRLVISLYEQAIEDLRRAVLAQERGDLETRTQEINHCFTVIAHLQGTLDMERGGEVARNLAKFYGMIRQGLTTALAQQSAALIQEQIAQLITVHEAWLEVERATGAGLLELPHENENVLASSITSGDWRA